MRSNKRSPRTESDQQPKTIAPGTVTSIEAQKNSTTRYSIFLDGEFAFGVSRDLLLESGLSKGVFVDRDAIDRILAKDAVDRAVASAMRALEQRMQTRLELRTRLMRKGFESETIDTAMERLSNYGYLNDERFAELWIENRLAHRPRGRRMLEQELRQKGIDRQIIQETVANMEIDDRSAAIELATKRLRSVQGLPAAEQKKKLTGILARKGFDFGTIRFTLETVLEEDADPLEMGDPDGGVV
ncbi:MAG: RecX family transcriptional regulator [Thermomicrobiales bacterium]|nr:RecX family transcriptional regulator [Thermomicrobiales bacterium]MCO5221921.1 RecX family transcriptional regulator [Thermomicrobiales bacterium]